MASELKVDTISENTTASGVTIDGVELKDGSVKGNGLGRKNYIINGNFDIWQRGTSETGRTSSGYAADRWFINPSGGTIASSQQAFTPGQTDVPNEPGYFYRFTNSVAADNAGLWQKIEGVRSLAGQTATISFYAKYTTNAPTSLTLDMNQDFGSSGSTDVATSIQTGITLTTSWQKFTYTFTVPSISGKTVAGGDDNISFRIGNPNTEIWDMDIAQVQVEKGSVATNFEVRPIAEEQSLCNRYYQIYIEGFQGIATGAMYNSTTVLGVINFEEMRVAPSLEVVTGTNYYRFWRNNSSDDFNDFAFSGAIGKKSLRLQSNTNLSGTAGQCGTIEGYHANAKMALDAEL